MIQTVGSFPNLHIESVKHSLLVGMFLFFLSKELVKIFLIILLVLVDTLFGVLINNDPLELPLHFDELLGAIIVFFLPSGQNALHCLFEGALFRRQQ